MSVESALVAIAREVAKQIARIWITPHTQRNRQRTDLADLVATGVKDQIRRRKLVRQLEEIADQAADRLEPLLAAEFQSIPPNERAAAIMAAANTLAVADLSDDLLLRLNFNPRSIADYLMQNSADARRRSALSEAGEAIYEITVRESVLVLVKAIEQLPEFDSRVLVEVLARSSTVAGQISEILARIPRTTLSAPTGQAHDEDFLRRYQSHISTTLDELELFGIDTHSYRLKTKVTTAYLSLRVAVPGHYTFDGTEPDRVGDEVASSSAIELALSTNSRILLRGEAGSGKTTLLQWLAVNAARGTFGPALAPWNGSVPFLVRLRSFGDESLPRPEELANAIAGPIVGFMPDGWIHRQLESGRALLLIDGVDELRATQRPRVRRWLRELLAAYPDPKVVVTSRPSAAAGSWLDDEGFLGISLEPMGSHDVEAFCHKWHEAVAEAAESNSSTLPCRVEEVPLYRSAVLRHLSARPHLKSLATNPLMCAMLCALNLDRRRQLPPDRMRLYADALQLLIDRRDAEREIPATDELILDSSVKIAILQHLAWRLSLTGSAELKKEDAEFHVGRAIASTVSVSAPASKVLAYLLDRSGVIREPVTGRIDFVHRTFQEYLAAKECAEDHLLEMLVERAHLDQWRETIIMAAGHATGPNRDLLLTGLLERAAKEPRHSRRLKLLAAACLETVQKMEPRITLGIDKALGEVLPPRAMREARSAAMAGERALRLLTPEGDQSGSVARASIWATAYINGPQALDVLSSYANDERWIVQYALQQVWKMFDLDEYARRILARAPLLPYRGSPGHLSIESTGQIGSLHLLERLKSVAATINYQELDDFSIFESVPLLHMVSVSARKPLNLADLKGHQHLELIGIYGPPPSAGFAKLHAMPNLKRLRLPVANISGKNLQRIIELENLVELEVQGFDHVRGIAPLEPLLDSLEDIGFVDSPGVKDLSPLADSHVEYLRVDGCPIDDLSPIRDMPRLKNVWLRNTSASDLSPLADNPSLRRLMLYGHEPLDLSVFGDRQNPLRIQVLRSNRRNIRGADQLKGPVKLVHL